MNQTELLKTANEQLNRILSFFPRAETKSSILLGINTAMLAMIAQKFSTFLRFDYWILIIFAPILLNGISLWCLYKSSSPQLKGGHDSLVYQIIENKFKIIPA